MKTKKFLSWILAVAMTAAVLTTLPFAVSAAGSLTVDQSYIANAEFKMLDNSNAASVGAVAAHHVFLEEYRPGGSHSYGYISTYNAWKYNPSIDYNGMTLENPLPTADYTYDYDYAYVAYQVSAGEGKIIDTIEIALKGYVVGSHMSGENTRYEQLGVFLTNDLGADADGKINLKNMTCLHVYGAGATEDFRSAAETISVSSADVTAAIGSSRDAYIVVVPFISWAGETGNADTASGAGTTNARLGAITVTATEKAGAAVVPTPGTPSQPATPASSLNVNADYIANTEFKLLDNGNAAGVGAVAAHHVFLEEYRPGGSHSYGYISTYNAWKYNPSVDYNGMTLETLLPRKDYTYDYDYAYVAYQVSAGKGKIIDTIEIALKGYVVGSHMSGENTRYEQLGVFLTNDLGADADGKINLKNMTCLHVYGTGETEDFRSAAQTISVSSADVAAAIGSSRKAYIVVVPFISWAGETGNADTASGAGTTNARLGAVSITATEKAGGSSHNTETADAMTTVAAVALLAAVGTALTIRRRKETF